MPPARPFSTFERTSEFDSAYRLLDMHRKKQVDKAIAFLFSNPAHPGLVVHQIKPGKYFWEAYVNQGDRIIYVPVGTHLVLVDIVKHDDIGRYGKTS